MPDKSEIEVKFALKDPQSIKTDLLKLGASYVGGRHEQNIRLDNSERSLTDKGVVLRLRRIEQNNSTSFVLTIKTPTEQQESNLRIRREIEFGITGDEESTLAALAVLGYIPYWRYEKVRSTYEWEVVEIVIDHMPFGWFMEIEGEPEAIHKCIDKLNLDLDDGITLSYQQIYENVRQKLNMPFGDLTFENFSNIEINPAWYTLAE